MRWSCVLAILLVSCSDEESPTSGPSNDAGVQPAGDPPPSMPVAEAGTWGGLIQVDCPVGTAVELEDNDSPDKANPIGELSFCGAISPGSDVDHSKFKTPDGKKLTLFQAVIDGAVDFDLVVNGKTLKPADVRKFEGGEYLVKAYTKDGKPGKYRYRVAF